MNRKVIATILISTIACLSTAQSFSRINNYWDNLYSINPASINDAYLGSASMAVRKQWAGFPGAPTLMQGTATVYFEDYYTQIGTKILAESKGLAHQLQFDISYTYALLLRNQWVLNMALALNFQNLSYDITEITFPANTIPEVYDRLLVNNNLNAGIGFELNYYNYKFGLASQNLITAIKAKNDLHPNTNIFYAAFREQNSDYANIGLGISLFQQKNIFQGEFNVNAYFKKTMESEKIQLGVIYRTWREAAFLFGVDLDRFKILYSFDYNFSPIYRHSYGSHEIMLIYNFNRTYRCINCGWY